jgi:hypothetical protein
LYTHTHIHIPRPHLKYIMFLNNETLKIVIGYALCIAAHFGAAHFYARYCTEPSLIGFVTSPFMTMSPQCQAGRWIIYNAAYSINIMWVLTAKWLIFKIAEVLPFAKGQSSFDSVTKEPKLKEADEVIDYDSDKSDDTLTI